MPWCSASPSRCSWGFRTSGPPPKFLRTRLDIPLRALTAAVVVAIVTTASYRIGSLASGMFALFPIVLCSFVVILHPRIGGRATASVLAHAQVAFVGLGLGFLLVHYLAIAIGSWLALLAGGTCGVCGVERDAFVDPHARSAAGGMNAGFARIMKK